jgi:transposase-like protein
MPKSKSRIFSREFKLSALSRMDGGENVSALSRELNVRRKLLYEWRDAFRAGGEEALRPPGRPPKGALVVGAGTGTAGGSDVAQPAGGPPAELAAAHRRIAELERKVGQQALEADFLGEALQLLEISRRPRVGTGARASSASSGPGCGGKAAEKAD